MRVGRYKTVEERIEVRRVCRRLLADLLFRSQNTSKPLSFLPSTAEMRRNLDDHVSSRQVDRRVSDLTEKNGVEQVRLLKEREDVVTLVLIGLAVDVGTLQAAGEHLKCE